MRHLNLSKPRQLRASQSSSPSDETKRLRVSAFVESSDCRSPIPSPISKEDYRGESRDSRNDPDTRAANNPGGPCAERRSQSKIHKRSPSDRQAGAEASLN